MAALVSLDLTTTPAILHQIRIHASDLISAGEVIDALVRREKEGLSALIRTI